MRHVSNKAPAQTKVVIAKPQVERLTPGGKKERALVEFVNSHNHNQVLQSEEVELEKGRIPLKSLMAKWRVKKPLWLDADIGLSAMPDGYSDCSFVGIDKIRIIDESPH